MLHEVKRVVASALSNLSRGNSLVPQYRGVISESQNLGFGTTTLHLLPYLLLGRDSEKS